MQRSILHLRGYSIAEERIRASCVVGWEGMPKYGFIRPFGETLDCLELTETVLKLGTCPILLELIPGSGCP